MCPTGPPSAMQVFSYCTAAKSELQARIFDRFTEAMRNSRLELEFVIRQIASIEGIRRDSANHAHNPRFEANLPRAIFAIIFP